MSRTTHNSERICVMPAGPFDKAFDYWSNDSTPPQIGQIVEVPLGKRTALGVVWDTHVDLTLDTKKIKPIERALSYNLTSEFLKTLQWLANYTTIKPGILVKNVFGSVNPFSGMRKKTDIISSIIDPKDIHLSPEQKKAFEIISQQNLKHQPILLDGVTGSGKTEVYMQLIKEKLCLGKQCLIMVPEIALTPDWEQRFFQRFGFTCHVWHSQIPSSQRKVIWHKTIQGEPLVVVGARSSVFLPFTKLGLIVVDEEHDPSYKQDDTPVYQARDMAILRAHFEKTQIILSSATPSLESWWHAMQNKYLHVPLVNRFGKAQLPSIEVSDLRQTKAVPSHEGVFLSQTLLEQMQFTLQKQEQVLLFLNRRGYAPLTLCGSCGYRCQCPQCSTTLVHHRKTLKIQCHQCGYFELLPDTCPQCHKSSLIQCGAGVEKVADIIQKIFPTHKTAIISSDTLTTTKDMQNLLTRIAENQVDILIGTQIIAKGHHFPNLTFVGVLDVDTSFAGGSGIDMRAAERTFQIIQQVSGRAGREEKPGRVLLQTFQPHHPVIQALLHNEREALYNLEIQQRQDASLPPFGRLVGIILSSTQAQFVKDWAIKMKEFLPSHPDVTIYGPAPAPIEKIRKHFRWRFLLQSPRSFPLSEYVRSWIQSIPSTPAHLRIKIDVDPYNFL